MRAAVKLFREFVGFSRENKMYWMIPLVLILGIASFLIVASQTAAPLVYTLF